MFRTKRKEQAFGELIVGDELASESADDDAVVQLDQDEQVFFITDVLVVMNGSQSIIGEK